MIAVGEKLPEATFFEMTEDGPAKVESGEIFAGKTVALFAVPGAFTPTCHLKHLPSFVSGMAALKEKGVDTVACVAVNDPFVMGEWGKATGASAAGIRMLGDPEGKFAAATGLHFDGAAVGLGTRFQRFAMLAKDGEVITLAVEDAPSSADKTTAEALIAAMPV